MSGILAGKRLLIVEDDVANMAVYAVILRKTGAIVIQDPWNAATIDLIKRHQPIDLIILDLMLRHGVSGYTIFDKIRSEPELGSIPVVAVSAADPGVEIPKAQAKGFVGFIPKPIQMLTFADQLAACINGESIWVDTGWQRQVSNTG